MATGEKERTWFKTFTLGTILFIDGEKKSPKADVLTHVVDSSWNDDIYVLLRLVWGKKNLLIIIMIVWIYVAHFKATTELFIEPFLRSHRW